ASPRRRSAAPPRPARPARARGSPPARRDESEQQRRSRRCRDRDLDADLPESRSLTPRSELDVASNELRELVGELAEELVGTRSVTEGSVGKGGHGREPFFARLVARCMSASCADTTRSPDPGDVRVHVPSAPSSHEKRVSPSNASST